MQRDTGSYPQGVHSSRYGLAASSGGPRRTAHRWPEFLPGGEALLFTVARGDRAYPQNLETWVLDLNSNQRTLLATGGGNPHYSPSGHVVFGVDGTLRAVPFDLDRLEVTGAPVVVLDGVKTFGTETWGAGAANFSIGQDGSDDSRY